MDRPVGFGKPNPPLPQSAPDPSQEHFLRASDQHRRASQSQKRRDRPSSTKLFFEPTSPLRHRRQPEALSNAVQNKCWVVVAQDRTSPFRLSSRSRLRQFRRDHNQVADRLATGKGDGPAKALRVFAEAGREPVDARTLQGKEALFVDGRPDGPDVGIATQHRKGVEFELAPSSVSPIKRSTLSRTWVVVSFIRFVYSKVPKRWYAFFMVCLADLDLDWEESPSRPVPAVGGKPGPLASLSFAGRTLAARDRESRTAVSDGCLVCRWETGDVMSAARV